MLRFSGNHCVTHSFRSPVVKIFFWCAKRSQRWRAYFHQCRLLAKKGHRGILLDGHFHPLSILESTSTSSAEAPPTKIEPSGAPVQCVSTACWRWDCRKLSNFVLCGTTLSWNLYWTFRQHGRCQQSRRSAASVLFKRMTEQAGEAKLACVE